MKTVKTLAVIVIALSLCSCGSTIVYDADGLRLFLPTPPVATPVEDTK